MSVIRTLAGTWLGRAVGGVVVIALVGGVLVAPRLSSGAAKAELRTSPVTRGSILQTVAVSGAVNPSAQVRLNFKSTGRLADVMVKVGDQVAAGQAIARLDTSDMEIALRQAQANLMSAQAKYDQTLAGSSPEDIAIANNAVESARKALELTQRSTQTDLTSAQQSLAKLQTSYADAKDSFSTLTRTMGSDTNGYGQALSPIAGQVLNVRGTLDSVLRPGDVTTARNQLLTAEIALANANTLVTQTLGPAVSDLANAAGLVQAAVTLFDRWLAEGRDTAPAVGQFQSAQTSFQTASSHLTGALDAVAAQVTSAQTGVSAAQAALSSAGARADPGLDQPRLDVASILSTITNEQQLAASIKARASQAATALGPISDAIVGGYINATQAVRSAQDKASSSLTSQESAVRSAQLSLQKTTASARSYDITQALAALTLQQIAVDKAKLDLDNATLKAPATGTVASIANQVGETVGTGATGFVVLALTSTVALHGTIGEADVAKLRLGQVATVTVDAVGATNRLTGRVTSLDPVATIQQGVPVYGIDVTIDIPDAAVRPGMTGTANVIIASKQGVLTVPNLAIRSASGRRFVMVKRNDRAEEADVTFGIANDTVTEVISGLEEGDQVVLPAPRTATGQQGQPGGQAGGFPGGGGGGPTVIRR